MYCKSKAWKHFVTAKVLSQHNVIEWLILMQSFQYDAMVAPSNLKRNSGGFNALVSFLGPCQHSFGRHPNFYNFKYLICKLKVLLVVLIYCESIIGILEVNFRKLHTWSDWFQNRHYCFNFNIKCFQLFKTENKSKWPSVFALRKMAKIASFFSCAQIVIAFFCCNF